MPIPSWATIFSENFRSRRRRTNIYYSAEANSYQLSDNEDAVILKNRRGKAFSKKASRSRDIIGATKTKDGFSVLIEGTDIQLNERYRVLYANTDGTITSRTNWSTETPFNKGYEEDSISNKPGQISSLSNIFNTASADTDSNGVVDGSELIAYQIHQNGSAITLSNRKGKTFNDLTSRNWDVTHIAKTLGGGDGFAVLREGTNRKSGLFRVWYTNRFGVITSGTKWKSRLKLASEGFEEIFPIDFNGDGYLAYDFINNVDTRGLVNVGESISSKLNTSRDKDWLRVNLKKDHIYQFDLIGHALTDPFLRLYDEDGLFITENDDGGNGLNSRILHTAQKTKSYFLEADSYLSNKTGTYTLSVTQTAAPPTDDENNEPTGSVFISGNAIEGQTLTASNNITDEDGLGPISYQWLRDGNAISGATSNTYILIQPDVGETISVIASFTDGEGTSESITSAPTQAVVNVNDLPTGSVIISGNAIEGQTLTASNNITDEDGLGPISYQWLRDGNAISGATSNTYILIQPDVGETISVIASFTDGEGTSESITSASTSTVQDQNDDYGSDIDTEGLITIGSQILGEINRPGDKDWIKVKLKKNFTYQFDLIGETLSDSLLRLYSQDGSYITENDDGGNGLDSRIVHTAQETKSYFLEADSYLSNKNGTYTLSATQTSGAPQPGWKSTDGWGEVSAKRAFESLLSITLPSQVNLGGNYWGADKVEAPEVWESSPEFVGATGKGVTVAVIDTGVKTTHPEFSNVNIVSPFDFIENDTSPDDVDGHGTHVASTILGRYDGISATGDITGIAYNASLMPLKVLGDDGTGYISDIAAGIRYAVDNGAHVINLSLGGGGPSSLMREAIRYAANKAVVVMAAGNSSGSSPEYPAAYAAVDGIAVGAVNKLGEMADFSNLAGSEQISYITGPGVGVYSAIPGGYASYSGTSMAAPHVAGVAALLKSYDQSLTPDQITDLLISTASNKINNQFSQSTDNYNDTTNASSLITLDNIHNFTNEDLTGQVIGNIWGDKSTRQSTIESIRGEVNHDDFSFDDFNHFEILDPLTNNFASFALNSDAESDPLSTLNDLLSNNYFESFEIDQKWSII